MTDGQSFWRGAAAGEVFRAGAAAAVVSAGNVTAGQCYG